MEKLKKIVIDIAASKGNIDATSVSEKTDLRADLNFDSFDMAELTVRLEDVFGIDVFEDGIVETIGEISKKLKL